MPFKSEKQRRWMWANEPEMARRWTEEEESGKRERKREGKRKGFGPVQCASCIHFHAWRADGNYCDAFPDQQIPEEIIFGEFDHAKPHPEDNGIQREDGEAQYVGPDGETLASERMKLADALGITDYVPDPAHNGHGNGHNGNGSNGHHTASFTTADFAFNPDQPRDPRGRWTSGVGSPRKGPKQPAQRDAGGALGIGKGSVTTATSTGTGTAPVGAAWEGRNVSEGPAPKPLSIDSALHEQIVRLAAQDKVSMYDLAGVEQEARKQGFTELAEHARAMARQSDQAGWFTELVGLADEVNAMRGAGTLEANRHAVYVNLGLTAFRGTATGDVEQINRYYQSTRWKGFERSLDAIARQHAVQVVEEARAYGMWEGKMEPSASVTVRGAPESVRAVASHMGARYYQDAVMTFTPDEAAEGGMYVLEDVADVQIALQGLADVGLSGGRVVGNRIEIADDDGSLAEEVAVLSQRLRTRRKYTPGRVEWLSAGDDYQKGGYR